MKKTKLFIALFSLYLCSCASTQQKVDNFEKYLESFVGKKTGDIIKQKGNPNKYTTDINIPNAQNGSYMVYEKNQCIIAFLYSKQTLSILDWEYDGDCLNVKW